MEKENNRARSEAKKKLNDLVRALVAYVRKRDPRVVNHTSRLEEERAAKAAAAEAARRRKQAEYDSLRREEMSRRGAHWHSEEHAEVDALIDAYDEEETKGGRRRKGRLSLIHI
eukprot:6156675-Pleurochrysis_carterae.AAC.1